MTDNSWSDPETIEQARVKRIALVKVEAATRISSHDWKLQRAARHAKLNNTSKKGEIEVLEIQQAIEEASDQAEN